MSTVVLILICLALLRTLSILYKFNPFEKRVRRNIAEIIEILPNALPETWDKNNPGFSTILTKCTHPVTAYCVACILLVEGQDIEQPSDSLKRLGYLINSPLQYLEEDTLNIPKGYLNQIRSKWGNH